MGNSKDYENRGAKVRILICEVLRELGKCGNIGIRYEIDEWKSTHLRYFRLDLTRLCRFVMTPCITSRLVTYTHHHNLQLSQTSYSTLNIQHL